MHNTDLTQARLKELLTYDETTGLFTWRVRAGRSAAGSVADCRATHGYIRIRVDNVLYAAHRLVWLYVYGKFPDKTIDHINRARDDNRLANLRDVSHMENHQNKSMHSNNTSGVQGVHWCRRSQRWIAGIKVNYKYIHIGAFKDLEQAKLAREEAKQRLNKQESTDESH